MSAKLEPSLERPEGSDGRNGKVKKGLRTGGAEPAVHKEGLVPPGVIRTLMYSAVRPAAGVSSRLKLDDAVLGRQDLGRAGVGPACTVPVRRPEPFTRQSPDIRAA